MQYLVWATVLTNFATSSAYAIEMDASSEIYYFTSNSGKSSGVSMELAEDGQNFPAAKDPRQVALELARIELGKGNVCVAQMDQDLQAAVKENKVDQICRSIFKNELAEASERARVMRKRVVRFECEAGVEIRETSESMSLALVIRAFAKVSDRTTRKLARAGVRNPRDTWTMMPFETPLGEGSGWKDILKNRSCSLDSKALDRHFENFMRQAREDRSMARCRMGLSEDAEALARMQERFKAYVPEEWMRDAAGDDLPALLRPVAPFNPKLTLKECRAARKAAGKQAEELADLSESIASKHRIPALEPSAYSSGRSPASIGQMDSDEDED